MLFKKIVLIALGATVVNAHMLMTQPVPYGKGSLTNAPLLAGGDDFPCKLRGDTYTVTKENIMEIGSKQQLHLQGQATHGGGSCQISLTEDRAPSKSTSWKVIHSIEGGCPANVDGNMGGDAGAADPTFFNYTIPADIAPGKYTLAWTWFNRVGNREMYMNCAPVTITQSPAERFATVPSPQAVEKRTANYPPMFVANVNGCTTKEGIDIRFPRPGNSLEYNGKPANLAPEGQDACSGTPKFGVAGNTASGSGSSGSGSGSSGSGSGSGSAPTSSSSASNSAPSETSNQAGVSGPFSTLAPTATVAPSQTGLPSVPSPLYPSTSSVAPLPSSTTASDTLTGPCSQEGSWNCIGGTSFQRCANGQWTPIQQMAMGTRCAIGQSSDLAISAAKVRRTVSGLRFGKRHLGGVHHS